MSRLSCSFCILASRADLRRAADLRPDLYHTYAALERRIGHTLSPTLLPLPEVTGVPPVAGGDFENLASPISACPHTPARRRLSAWRAGYKPPQHNEQRAAEVPVTVGHPVGARAASLPSGACR